MSHPVNQTEAPIKLLLFTDKRPNSGEQIRQIRTHLKQLQGKHAHYLEVADVTEQPYLAEHFKLVATPALIKIAPLPQQTLTGSDIVPQLDHWWPQWQQEVEYIDRAALVEAEQNGAKSNDLVQPAFSSVTHSANLIELSDEIFRLKQTNEALMAQLQFKDRIIAMMAHDLRNPLTAASIAIETLEMGYGNPERASQLTPKLTTQLLCHAKTQIRAIDRMITDILQAARGASAELQMQPQPLQLKGLCLEVVESLSNKLEAKAQSMTTDIPQDLPRVYADRLQIRRVIVNLLDNAIKYTPAGGRIDVSALHRTTQKVQISIQDTGPGIPRENREKIFEESFRLQRDYAQDGYGLGLALCQRIIRAHYGQIWVDSLPRQGSSFHFTLPVYRE
ncbi:histidine kinase [Almyronema epifaneia]|uniref:Adaptive-response sensory-kinase SasA n=1 Tax=Almyronema epifaneia S1 TaxID=2991925 RepID=A0ABW6IIB4_9CYAN